MASNCVAIPCNYSDTCSKIRRWREMVAKKETSQHISLQKYHIWHYHRVKMQTGTVIFNEQQCKSLHKDTRDS